MKLCFHCGQRFDAPGWECPSCHTAPLQLGGFPAFAPELANTNTGFDASYFRQLIPLEARNFWFRARNQLIVWMLQKYFSTARKILEIGCGTGFVLSGVERALPEMELYGTEIYAEGLKYAASRLKRCTLLQMDARQIPFEKEFDVVGIFDVLEHIAEDELVIAQIHRTIRDGGGIIVMVPQHSFLWSQADEYARHVRRYNAKDLVTKIEKAGFKLIRRSSFVSLLLPLMMASRLMRRVPDEDFDPLAELRIGGIANSILEKVLDFERALIRAGISFPIGGSLLLVARKNR